MMNLIELLSPRYKVIADYPDSPFQIGDIILFKSFHLDPTVNAAYNDKGQFIAFESSFIAYPHLFKKLQWWEDRNPEEMPEYIKCINTPDQKIMPGQCFKVKWCIPGVGRAATGQWIVADTNCYIPITETEHLEYIKQYDAATNKS